MIECHWRNGIKRAAIVRRFTVEKCKTIRYFYFRAAFDYNHAFEASFVLIGPRDFDGNSSFCSDIFTLRTRSLFVRHLISPRWRGIVLPVVMAARPTHIQNNEKSARPAGTDHSFDKDDASRVSSISGRKIRANNVISQRHSEELIHISVQYHICEWC